MWLTCPNGPHTLLYGSRVLHNVPALHNVEVGWGLYASFLTFIRGLGMRKFKMTSHVRIDEHYMMQWIWINIHVYLDLIIQTLTTSVCHYSFIHNSGPKGKNKSDFKGQVKCKRYIMILTEQERTLKVRYMTFYKGQGQK